MNMKMPFVNTVIIDVSARNLFISKGIVNKVLEIIFYTNKQNTTSVYVDAAALTILTTMLSHSM